jgi:hypothetical protein
VLEHHAKVAVPGRHTRHVPALDQHAARIRLLQPGDHPQDRRLAGAAGAEEGEELAGMDIERDIVGRNGGAEALVQGVEAQDGLGHGRCLVPE